MALGAFEDRAVCIYCLHVSDGAGFNREHIIPQSVGGTIFIDNMVCESCNSQLGSQVDLEILKLPDVLRALENLGIPFNRRGVLRSHYDTYLVSNADRMRAKATDTGFQLITQDLVDGSRVTPGHNLDVEALEKMLNRDQRVREAGLGAERITHSLSELKKRLDDADIDEKVTSRELGLTVIKRSVQLHAEATAKGKVSVDRVIAKIAFEWMFSCFGRRFIEAAEWITDLRNLVCGCDNPPNIQIYRSEALNPEIRMSHSIHVLVYPSHTTVTIGLFGGIEYTLIAPAMDPFVLDEFRQQTGVLDAIGVAVQQDLANAKKNFFALRGDGTSEYLGCP